MKLLNRLLIGIFVLSNFGSGVLLGSDSAKSAISDPNSWNPAYGRFGYMVSPVATTVGDPFAELMANQDVAALMAIANQRLDLDDSGTQAIILDEMKKTWKERFPRASESSDSELIKNFIETWANDNRFNTTNLLTLSEIRQIAQNAVPPVVDLFAGLTVYSGNSSPGPIVASGNLDPIGAITPVPPAVVPMALPVSLPENDANLASVEQRLAARGSRYEDLIVADFNEKIRILSGALVVSVPGAQIDLKNIAKLEEYLLNNFNKIGGIDGYGYLLNNDYAAKLALFSAIRL